MTAATRKLNIRRNFRSPKLKQDSDNLATSNAAAKEGGPKEIAQGEKDRLTLEHDLDLLGSYALKVANGDPAVLTSSGFIPLPPRVRSEAQSLPTPGAPEIEQGLPANSTCPFHRLKVHTIMKCTLPRSSTDSLAHGPLRRWPSPGNR